MSDEIKVHSKNKKTKLIIAIAAVVIVVLTVVAIVLVSSNSATAKKVKEQLSLGEKYLSELDYEQAIAAYELAIEIDPKSVDAYLGLAEVYEEMGEYDRAIEILEEAKSIVGDGELGRIEEKLMKIEEKKQEVLKPVATATPVPTATLEPKPTLVPTATPVVEKNPLVTAKVGDVVRFGRFLQDYVQMGLDSEAFTYDESHSKLFDSCAHEVEWYVLDRKDNKILLLSKYVLDTKPYHKEATEVTWAQSSMREWLNSTFYNFVFNEEEKEHICKTKLMNSDNAEYGTEGGEATIDNVFLLSIEEAKKYFNFTYDSESMDGYEEYKSSGLDERLIGVVTNYAILNGSENYLIEEASEECSTWWYLRSMGRNNKLPAIVEPWGYINVHGYPSCVVDVPNGVRPAIWVDVTAGTSDSYILDLTDGSEERGESRLFHSLKANPENLLSFDEIKFLGHSIVDLNIDTVQRLFEENNYSVMSNLEWEAPNETDHLWLSGYSWDWPDENTRIADVTAMQYFSDDYVCSWGYTQYTHIEGKSPVGARNLNMHDTFGEVFEKLGFNNAYEVEKDIEYFFSKDPYEDGEIGEKDWNAFHGMTNYSYESRNGGWTESLKIRGNTIGASETEEERDYSFSLSLEDVSFQGIQSDKRYSLRLEFEQDENTNGKFILTNYSMSVTR